jgi:hypothetical protein
MLGQSATRRPSPLVTRLPPTSPHPYTYASSRVWPRTYTVALYILAGVLLLQVTMVISVFWLRAAIVPVNFSPPKAHATPLNTTAAVPANAPPELPDLAVSANRMLLALPSANDTQSQIANLLDRARTFRSNAGTATDPAVFDNDRKEELITLLQAEDLDPRNPDALRGLADLYDKLDDVPLSKIYWQRLLDLGPAVGRSYVDASDQINYFQQGSASDPLRIPSTLNRLVYIDEVTKTPVKNVNGAPQFQLRTVLMRKDPAMPDFDQKKLQPYVIFYQRMPDSAGSPGGTLVPDLRPHKGGFDNTFLFWNKTLQEGFNVEYALPVPGTPGPDGKPMGEYYGFVIGIYYDKTLQDARSEPADLITRLPLPDGIE